MSFDHISVKINYNHIICGHFIIGYSARFYHHKSGLGIYSRHIAPCEYHQAVPYKCQIGLEYLIFELLQHITKVLYT